MTVRSECQTLLILNFETLNESIRPSAIVNRILREQFTSAARCDFAFCSSTFPLPQGSGHALAESMDCFNYINSFCRAHE